MNRQIDEDFEKVEFRTDYRWGKSSKELRAKQLKGKSK